MIMIKFLVLAFGWYWRWPIDYRASLYFFTALFCLADEVLGGLGIGIDGVADVVRLQQFLLQLLSGTGLGGFLLRGFASAESKQSNERAAEGTDDVADFLHVFMF
jgi:hypothetical protein